ncbi:DUF3320 domain-containing protein [Phycicoccus duodecadis]|uniref:Uncharacterized protein DUF3320 n=1 Tax=Phycicoccus duodecadis TaxID=173053 RepID=A0A2N3YFV0_9MICO|nr:DUF3320 domain-containing protein [Phycicoccus duodecadis]PKW25732.1 uncharacterized protein DUF3320 [Phycicoccus duodecadis]
MGRPRSEVSSIPTDVDEALRVWRDGLINLSGTNRALNFKHTKTGSVPIDGPDIATVLAGLRAGRTWRLRGRPEPAESGEKSTTPPSDPTALSTSMLERDLSRALKNLQRREHQEYLDRGLIVLYFAFGMLDWADVDGTRFASPLLLVPVTLVPMGRQNDPKLKANDDGDAVLNPALALRLNDFGVTLPTVEDPETADVEELLDAVRSAVAKKPGWMVSSDVTLSVFSFMKEAMYRDLLENAEAIAAHPVVTALATQDPTAQGGGFLFEEIPTEQVDDEAPPESTPLVLDADSSQRACVAAAVAGHSFVMDGPPGTGKSQTIANMIGALLHTGKTVLFVSEKAAALEVVRNRLEHVGLGSYVLELHSHKASRKEVAAQLASALDTVPVPPPPMSARDRSQAADRRTQLSAYARAMNEVRPGLGRTVHEVLGRVAELDEAPHAPTPKSPGLALTETGLGAIADAAARLARCWRPALEGQSFLWRGVTDQSPFGARIYAARRGLEELEGVARHNDGLREAFDLPALSDLHLLDALIELSVARPAEVPNAWLTVEDLEIVKGAVSTVEAGIAAVRAEEQRVREVVGDAWRSLPPTEDLPSDYTVSVSTPSPVSVGALTGSRAEELRRRMSGWATTADGCRDSASRLAEVLGVPVPATFSDIDHVLSIAAIPFMDAPPEATWLTTDGLASARGAAQILGSRVRELAAAEAAAQGTFTPAALAAPLADLHARFTTVHKGFRKLMGEYRRDKKTVAAFKAEVVNLDDAIKDLGLAVSWSRAQADLGTAEQGMAGALGRYWQGRETDFERLDAALNHAEEILRAVPPALWPQAARTVAGVPDPSIKALVDRTRDDLVRLRGEVSDDGLGLNRPEVVVGSVAGASEWLRAHLEPLDRAAQVCAGVAAVIGRDLPADDALVMLEARDGALSARQRAIEAAAQAEAHIGHELYRGLETDLPAVHMGVTWATKVRKVRRGFDRPLSESQVKALMTARRTENLSLVISAWERARDAIIDAFEDDRREDLEDEMDLAATAASLIDELDGDGSGQQEWLGYVRATAELRDAGLRDVERFCVDHRVSSSVVPAVFERAVLSSFADAVLASDPSLSPFRSTDRDALVDEFRRLDQMLIPAATSGVITAANALRPRRLDVGEPALIRREGLKKTRHLPVRELISQTRTTTVAVKPCFMMSPLAVSQYLPPNMAFDVVIFDEASQVTPGDAINCIYRGKALITAGDDRQLPPTSFFDRAADEDEESDTDVSDFQSILELSKASGGFRNLGLRWHYRSRHEDLIAFSNHRFYEGRLVTFPGAHAEGPDVGVELFHVPGIYRRGTSRDNPVEAQHVAERVLHHLSTRPDASLGVVTFSVAQADAIQNALDRALDERPDLAAQLDGDRLNGFFVKSLESVQGDERDVMIFSIGYGPDENGKVTTNFGALNRPKGWRRLNVAVTRARQRVEVVSSVRAGDVPPSTNESVRHLVGYLDYAERGPAALALDLGPSGLGTDSPFEDSVIDAIRAMGYDVEPQVGAAGYRIDIGVKHIEHPGVFAIGVECDGYMYHSSPAARDRDRLRQQVLEGLGWRLHRIWGTAWYRDREREKERLRRAIEDALSAPVTGRLSGSISPFERAIVELEAVSEDEQPTWTVPYVPATVPPLPSWVDVSDPSARWEMVDGVRAVADGEGPVHVDVLQHRLREAWGIGRVGHRIHANIRAAIEAAEVTVVGDFVDVPSRRAFPVRVPVPGVTARTAGQVPDVELEEALVNLLRDSGRVDVEELLTATARIFGWGRRTQDMTRRLLDVVGGMSERGGVTREGATIRLSSDEAQR